MGALSGCQEQKEVAGEGLSFALELEEVEEEVDEEVDGPPQNSYLNTTNETRLQRLSRNRNIV